MTMAQALMLCPQMALRKKLHNELVDLKGNIRVYCRVRYVKNFQQPRVIII